jgi:hypothetical protein
VSAEDDIAELIRFIQAHGMAGKLLAEHEPGPDGRCARCAGGGDSSGRQVGCTLYRAALAAQGNGS